MLKRIFATLLLLFLVVTPAFGSHTLPWTKFSEQSKDAVMIDATSCGPDKGVMVIRFVVKEDAYLSFYGDESHQYVLLYYKGNVDGAGADEVGIGTLDPANHDTIPNLTWYTLEQAKALFPALCDALYPARV